MELVRYDAACRAVAEAKSIDEIKEISNRAEAARAYARQAKNRGLELDALEIRVRAERRLGEILIQLRGEGTIGQGRGGRPLRLSEIGVDTNISGGAQRMAKLPQARFESEIRTWRDRIENSQRVEVPLQHYRLPSRRAEGQKAAHRIGRVRIDAGDPLDRFRAPDGRRVADWRAGELQRIADLAHRAFECVKLLQQEMPVANPDPLATMEMIFDGSVLQRLLSQAWDAPIAISDTGLMGDRRQARREQNTRICQECGAEFQAHRPGSAARSGKARANVFCSRSCARRDMMRNRRLKNVGSELP